MNENRSMSDEELDARLTAEAGSQSPEFSQDLHERIMHRIADAPLNSPRSNWRLSAIAAAAILVIGLLVCVKMFSRMNSSPRPAVAIQSVPSLPQIRNPVRALDQPMNEWNDASYAYLDRDGEKMLGYMARQMDVVPTQKSR